MTEEPERRREGRSPLANLSVHVRSAGLLGGLRRLTIASWMDFHRSGMAFECERSFEVGSNHDVVAIPE